MYLLLCFDTKQRSSKCRIRSNSGSSTTLITCVSHAVRLKTGYSVASIEAYDWPNKETQEKLMR